MQFAPSYPQHLAKKQAEMELQEVHERALQEVHERALQEWDELGVYSVPSEEHVVICGEA